MLSFKQKRLLKTKEITLLSRLLSNSVLRFAVAGFFSILVTLLLFIFMNFLIGNFNKYANTITEKLFALHIVKLEKTPVGNVKRVQRPPELLTQPATEGNKGQNSQHSPEPPAQAVTGKKDVPLTNAERRRMIVESLLKDSDDAGKNKDQNDSSQQ